MANLIFLAFIICNSWIKITAIIPGCDYFDTVNLTDIEPSADGSYKYENITIPKHQTGNYSISILSNGREKHVTEHLRGCACQNATCIRFCCDPQQVLIESERRCESVQGMKYSSEVNITNNNGEETTVDIFNKFIIQKQLSVPCKNRFVLDKVGHNWTLFENGLLYNHQTNENVNKDQYCLQPQKISDGTYKIMAHQCAEEDKRLNAIVEYSSVICMTVTICVYMFLPKFRTAHYKSCTCYFICLTLSFVLILAEKHFRNWDYIDPCLFVGYIGYYFVMSMFLWLLIMNYGLWKKYKNIGIKRKLNFRKRSWFVWITSAVLLIITIVIDSVNKDKQSAWKPGFGHFSCWINTRSLPPLFFYYGPILFILVVNIVFFILTARNIFNESRDNQQTLGSAKNRASFKLFFRFFILAGVLWFLEIIGYLDKLYTNVEGQSYQIILDFLSSAQGIMLFCVTVLTQDVRHSLSEHIFNKKKKMCTVQPTANDSQA
ncbi:probable G-protein coupled receptor Mth-like 11 [Drosophila busckii]|uniref:probable G-protein coupled receptor Mth-like 11 n=1 Tax=Drosophila busckii TaxID=30019 RepID=UPI00083EB942|nr:probable G-protein coupled receptor Mth-like 11 [Drosophila busckii]XP_017849264.1 probable G-protein coupled receptor Mth-like 11 [Drosophila busckii]